MNNLQERTDAPVVRFIPSGSLLALCPRSDGAVDARIYPTPCALASARYPIAGFEIKDEVLADVEAALDYFFFKAPFVETPRLHKLNPATCTISAVRAMEELQQPGAVFMRGDPAAFLASYRALDDGFVIACIVSGSCSLTFRAIDVLDRLGRPEWLHARFDLSLTRDANRRDETELSPVIEERFEALPPQVRVFLDFKRNGGAVMCFKKVRCSSAEPEEG